MWVVRNLRFGVQNRVATWTLQMYWSTRLWMVKWGEGSLIHFRFRLSLPPSSSKRSMPTPYGSHSVCLQFARLDLVLRSSITISWCAIVKVEHLSPWQFFFSRGHCIVQIILQLFSPCYVVFTMTFCVQYVSWCLPKMCTYSSRVWSIGRFL